MRSFHLLVFALPVLWFGILFLRTPAADDLEGRPDHDQLVRKNVHIVESRIQEAKLAGEILLDEDARRIVHELRWGCEHGCKDHVVNWELEFHTPGDGSWWLECRPDVKATYALPFVVRILTLDYSQHLWPTFRLTSEGTHREIPPDGVEPVGFLARAGVALGVSVPYWLLMYFLLVVVPRWREKERTIPVIVSGYDKPRAGGPPSR
jgi:hypothetical protein